MFLENVMVCYLLNVVDSRNRVIVLCEDRKWALRLLNDLAYSGVGRADMDIAEGCAGQDHGWKITEYAERECTKRSCRQT